MTRRTTIAIVTVVVVLVLVAGESLLGAQVAHVHQHVDGQRLVLSRTRADIGATDAAIAARKSTLAQTNRDIASRTHEEVGAFGALLNAKKVLTDVDGQLAAANVRSAAAAAAVAGLHSCLDATNNATVAHKAGDGGRAISILRGAQAQCEARVADGDPDAAVFPFDFADPSIMRVGNTYYAYSTNGSLGNMQVISSTDLERWQILGDAMPFLPSWAVRGATWAPAVASIGSRFVAYYTVREAATFLECISVGVSSSPTGPFIDVSPRPLICQRDRGGSIDPRPFVDAFGGVTLVWKSEGAGNVPAQIWSQRVSPDGTKLTGVPSNLITADRPWEAGVVEAPVFVARSGVLGLFYSGGVWSDDSYAIGEAVCDSPTGPCRKVPTPVLTSHDSIAGPGSPDFVTAPNGDLWMLYSAFRSPHVGYPSSRLLHVARVDLEPDRVKFRAR